MYDNFIGKRICLPLTHRLLHCPSTCFRYAHVMSHAFMNRNIKVFNALGNEVNNSWSQKLIRLYDLSIASNHIVVRVMRYYKSNISCART